MRILGIVASPRKEGNTEILVNEALAATREAGAETDLFLVADKGIAPCDGCLACLKTGVCRVKDDMQELYQKIEPADGIIFGTPVYFGNVSGQAKVIMDRTYALMQNRKLRGKTGAAIVVARRVGAGSALSLLYTYFVAQGIVVAGGGIGYGREKGEVRQVTGGAATASAIDEARAVGRAIVRTTDMVIKGKK